MMEIALILYALPAVWLLSLSRSLENFLSQLINDDERELKAWAMRALMALVIVFWPAFALVDVVLGFFEGDE